MLGRKARLDAKLEPPIALMMRPENPLFENGFASVEQIEQLEINIEELREAIERSRRLSSFRSYGDASSSTASTHLSPNGSGQYLPSDEIPKFHPLGPRHPAGAIRRERLVDDAGPSKFQSALRLPLRYIRIGKGLGGAPQDIDPRALVFQPAVSDAILRQTRKARLCLCPALVATFAAPVRRGEAHSEETRT